MVIGIDIDDVLADSLGLFLEFHNDVYGTNFARSEVKSYYHKDVIGYDFDMLAEKFNNFYNSSYFKLIQPLPGAVQAIKQLSKKHSLHVITSRPDSIQSLTQAWIQQHFGTMLPNLHFASVGTSVKKSDICRKMGVSVHIDDAVEFALDCSGSNVQVLLMDSPWNTQIDDKTILRVGSWDEILQKVATIEAQCQQQVIPNGHSLRN